VNRLEFYEGGKLVRTEEDANGDGQPDRRLTYGPSGVKTTILR
jgi:hypothetical protein